MSDAVAAAATETAPVAPPPAASDQADALAALLKLPVDAPKGTETVAEPKVEPKNDQRGTKEPEHLAAANGRKPPKDPIDPLNESDFSDDQLKTPEAVRAAAERIQKARRQALELTRASHRAHAAAEMREKKLLTREASNDEREKRAAAWERAVSTAIDDLESGDSERFLTAVGKLSKSGDPAGFWRNAALSIAKGERLKPQQAAQASADPELKARLERLESVLTGREEQEQVSLIEQAKDRNFEAAKNNTETPRLQVYASDPRTAGEIREALAQVMELAYQQSGRPIDIGEACRRLESNLAVHFELSQRADGKTNGAKETTSPGLDAGRETSREQPPKPETSQATIPAALSSAPASAHRSMNEDELKGLQIRQLDAIGFFD